MCLSYESNNQGNSKPSETPKPALVFLPSKPTNGKIAPQSVTNNGAVLTGCTASGSMGPVVGKVDFSESYDGQILIKGVTTTGEKTVYKGSMKFEMLTQRFCPPSSFAVSFKLLGPVYSQQLTAHFGIDGIFEGILKKKIASN